MIREMDPIFRAGRALGQSEILRLEGKNGVAYVNKAAAELKRSRIRGLDGVSTHLQGIASNWKGRSSELPGITPAIQAHGGRTYQAVSCGLLLGLAMEACRQAGKDTVTSRAKNQIVTWLKSASDHAYALKAQGLVKHMGDYRPNFNRVIAPIQVVKRSSELRNHYRFVENLSNTIGNAIR
ncbi:MAG: hypothetical protein A7316_03595 [Candidatus Altiarchaeales archaeon WOR_SM1_86-2]|nr:MAG: hypothetical protein A7316_03595 [Candidatus Altiarchaeales archaeon WOR_SM1_86-2]